MTDTKLRPAVMVSSEICGCATLDKRKRDIAVIEADRAALVAEIVADLRDLDGMRDETNLIGWAANQIEQKWAAK